MNREPQIPKRFFYCGDYALFTEIDFDYYNQIIIEKVTRIKNFKKQEDEIKSKAEKIQAEVMKKLQEKK